MNDTDKQEKDAAEVETEVETEMEADAELAPEEETSLEPPVEEQVEQPAPAAKRSGGSFLAFLALLLAGAALGAGYYLWQQLEQVRREGDSLRASLAQELRAQPSELPGQLSALETELSNLRAEVSPLQAQISTLGQELQQRAGQDSGITAGALDALQRQISEIREQVASQAANQAASQTREGETVWMVAEVEYLMLVANRRLQLEQDVQTATAALQMADKRLQQSGDPRWVAVREQLAAELAALRSVPSVDRDGLSLRIATLIEQVASIEPVMVTGAAAAVEEEEAVSATAREERSLETLPGDIWQYFKSQVDIRHRDRKLPLYLPPEQLHFLKQNLQLRLEAARYAVLRSEQQLYTDSLERAAARLTEYFDSEQDGVKTLLTEIEQLKQQVIQPPLPDISGSLQTLRARAGSGAEAKQP
jgi:uroporphyrin-3 C-methyltransferase